MAYDVLSKGKLDGLVKESAPRRIKPFDWISLASLIAILIIFIYAGYFTREFMVDVTEVSQVFPFDLHTRFTAEGRVIVEHEIEVVPKIAGQITEIMVDQGSRVKKGQVIAGIENTDAALFRDQSDADLKLAQATLEQARLGYSEAMLSHDKSRKMFQGSSITEAEYHASASALRKAKSAMNVAAASVRSQTAVLRGAEVALGYTLIKAPVDGIVLKKNVYPGDTVTPLSLSAQDNSWIVTLADISSLQVEVEVPEAEREYIKRGDPCAIIIDALGSEHFIGEVNSVLPAAGEQEAAALVRVDFTDSSNRVLPDMKARVAFLTHHVSSLEDKPLTVIDRSALLNEKGVYSVMVVQNDRAIEKKVRIGSQFKDRVEIREGVSVGELVVINPPVGLENGSKVIADKD